MELPVNQRIRDLRKSLKLNQSEFAKTLGVTQTTICNVESGKAGYSIELLTKIAETYNKEITYFFEKDITKEKPKKESFYNREEFLEFRGFLKGLLPADLWEKVLPMFPKYKVSPSVQV